MDALDIVMQKEKVVAHFQPIVSADTLEITGYEVMGRFHENETESMSLRVFFQDHSIPDEYRQEVEDHIHDQALNAYLEEGRDEVLFLNVDVNLLVQDGGESFVERLKEFQEKGLTFDKIVLELKEHHFIGDQSQLKHFVQYVQSLGIKVALDDVGKNTTNLDQIAYLMPNIIKVDLAFTEENSIPSMFRDVLHSLSMLSRKIGASLLFEEVNGFNQLNYAWRNGARYFQGDYLRKPKNAFSDKQMLTEVLRKDFHHFITLERKKMEAQIELMTSMNKRLGAILKKEGQWTDVDALTMNIAHALEDISFRVYICDHEGYQKSGNALKETEGWTYHPEGRNRNWSWRPYFLENIVRMNFEKRGILSDLYSDIHQNEMIRTYSHPLTDDLYVFIDIPYEYLFEKDHLI
ncbi:EAL domain-containing protein [Sinobaca sp. H24]|uniref:EAL domain-containing protein n=1 Tax=Sinobaca sp. H24 TaxID=2923376 RepID=UPI0020794D51|nr:EAL-associated domain-containing protein [Sinobaca sp. H24]